MSTQQPGGIPVDTFSSIGITPHSHVVQFYTRDSALITGLASFVRTALRTGDSVVVIGTEDHNRQLQDELKNARVNLRHQRAGGRFKLVDAEKTLASIMVDGVPDREAFHRTVAPLFASARASARSRFRNVSAFGEMVAVLAAQANFEAAILIEQFWNEFARSTHLVLHCAYPVHLFADPSSEEIYMRICREHTNVLPA